MGGLVSIANAAPKPIIVKVMALNFDAVVEGCRVALPHVRARAEGGKPGWIVNISSVFGMMGYPTQSAYNASKYAVRGLTEALADRTSSAAVATPRRGRSGAATGR